MPEHLSPSSIKLFDECPRRWADSYIDLNRYESGKYADIGTAVHLVMQEFSKNGKPYSPDAPEYKVIPAHERANVVKYVADRTDKRRYVIAVEQEFFVDLPGVKHKAKGFIDTVYWYPETQTIEIEDHKTNRKYEDRDEWMAKIQPQIYLLIASTVLYPGAMNYRFTIGYPNLGTGVSWYHNMEDNARILERFREASNKVALMEGSPSHSFPEKVNDNCKYCPLRSKCPSYKNAINNFQDSVSMIGEKPESPIDRYLRLKQVKKLIEAELKEAEEQVLKILESGPVKAGDREISRTKSSQRKVRFSDFWNALIDRNDPDMELADKIWVHMDELVTLGVTKVDALLKRYPGLKSRVEAVVRQEVSDEWSISDKALKPLK